MLFTKGASGNAGSNANKVVAAGKGGNEENKDDGKELAGNGGIVIYSGDDDGGVGECDDEDLRLLESMGAKNKATEGKEEPAEDVDAAVETKGRIHTHLKY